jgi:hypothetical protein
MLDPSRTPSASAVSRFVLRPGGANPRSAIAAGYWDWGSGLRVDPDAATRVFSPSAVPPPAAGTAGSYQDYATRIPDNPFIAQVPRITPLNAGGGKYGGQARINGDLTTTTCTSGGDGDTAPANVYVQYVIKARS